MTKLVGQHLEEMADIRSTRKKKIVGLCSVAASVMFFYCAIDQFAQSDLALAALNGLAAMICLGNFLYIKSVENPLYADLVLSCLMLLDALLLFLYGNATADKMLVLFPLLATVILINSFNIGLLLSGSFCFIVAYSLFFAKTVVLTGLLDTTQFFIALIATCIVCHTSTYYYSKVVHYIQSLYQEGIEDLAYLDQLTGLANRWSFENWAKDKLREIDATPSTCITALVFLDIDNFKHINDAYGHDVGDRVLQHFANRLKNNVRNKNRRTDKHDYSIARFAGDEFVLMLYDVKTKQDLDKILQRIVGLFTTGYLAHERINELTLSVGAAIYQQDAFELSELTRCADKAMYSAKHSGKNQYAYYENCTPPLPQKKMTNSEPLPPTGNVSLFIKKANSSAE
ncbi:TPA: GGDEF domain-containing protein [Vibrio vulnificus]|nr:diguanylate cyclase [Vibrio vulnificus]HAS6373966.1 diguanylate cyclase [Vibrio vulnificus]HDY7649331.1 GGDEF domain-containing protein [Vibrio vulnificus]